METNDIPPELLAQMREAAIKAMSPVRDPEAMKIACERMDRMREEIKKKHGILDIGVPAIRELRDE
jgi:succinate dehydrogenase/fumarate reductase flavoprotein subunit